MGEEPPQGQPYVTKTGRELSDAEIEALSAEAERGYDVSHLLAVPEVYSWDVSLKFRLTRGEFDLSAESALYAEGVRREIDAGAFRYVCYVETTHPLVAQAEAHTKLVDLLRGYHVGVFVFDARVVCLGAPR